MERWSLVTIEMLVVGLMACTSTPPPPIHASDTTEKTTDTPATSASDLASIEAALSAKDYEQAKRRAETLLARNQNHPQALYYAGVAADGLGDPLGAESRYRRALAVAPQLNEAAINLAVLLVEQKRAAEAITVLRPLAEKTPNDALIHANLAAALMASGDAQEAVRTYEKSIAKGGGVPARLGLAEAKEVLKDHTGALRALRDGLPEAEKSRERLAALALAMARLNAFDEAIATMDRAIRLQSSAELLTYRGLFQRSRKDLAAAQRNFQAATEQFPDFAPAYLYLGEVSEELKRPDEAKKSYETAIKLAGASDVGKRATRRLAKLSGKAQEKNP